MSALGGLIGGAFSIGSSALSAKKNMELAKKQMKFQKYMSNTAYRRSMRDMRLAGLNPMLASRLGGASTPPGARADISYADPGPAITSALTGIQQRRNMSAQEKLTNEQLNTERYRQAQAGAETALAQQRAATDAALRQKVPADIAAVVSSTEGQRINNAKEAVGLPGAKAKGQVTDDIWDSVMEFYQNPAETSRKYWDRYKHLITSDEPLDPRSPAGRAKEVIKQWRPNLQWRNR